jgi:hypothetical protein
MIGQDIARQGAVGTFAGVDSNNWRGLLLMDLLQGTNRRGER